MPWLLDAGSSELINQQENRAQIAEKSLAETQATRQKHVAFAELIGVGHAIVNKFARCGAPAELENFKGELEEWKKAVAKELTVLCPTEAPSFVQAYTKAQPFAGVVDWRYNSEKCRRQSQCHVDVLEEIVKRRLP